MLRRKANQEAEQRAVVDAIRKQASMASVRQFNRRLSGYEPVSETSQRMNTLLQQLKNSETEQRSR